MMINYYNENKIFPEEDARQNFIEQINKDS